MFVPRVAPFVFVVSFFCETRERGEEGEVGQTKQERNEEGPDNPVDVKEFEADLVLCGAELEGDSPYAPQQHRHEGE